jgi:YD repeat-containing protein
MKLQNRLVYILAVLFTLPLLGTVAPAATLTVLQRFDFHGYGVQPTATLPQKFSDQGDLTGTVIDVSGTAQGFIYKYRLGKFSAPFSEPNDTGNDTQGRGINNLRHVCGEYLVESGDTFHGYILEHPNFVEFDVTGAFDTIPLGINNAGDIVGTVIFGVGPQLAFVNWNSQGRLVTFEVPDATATFAYQVNTFHHIIGYYIDANGITHGFTRDSAGNLTFPIDMPGSTGTILFGNNDLDWGVGRYTDASGVTHGLYFITPDNMLTFDAPFPGATFTSLNGVNVHGQVCGYYVDTTGISHGLVLQMDADATPNSTSATTPTQPWSPTPTSAPRAYPLPKMLKLAAPAL